MADMTVEARLAEISARMERLPPLEAMLTQCVNQVHSVGKDLSGLVAALGGLRDLMDAQDREVRTLVGSVRELLEKEEGSVRQLWVEVAELKKRPNGSVVADHEERLRHLERWRWMIAGGIALADAIGIGALIRSLG